THDLLDIRHAAQIAAATHHVFPLAHLDHAAADIHVAGADRLGEFGQRDAVGAQLHRVDDDLVLLDEAADARDLGHAFGLGELIPDEPVLNCPQLGEAPVGAEHGGVKDPADAAP